MKYYTMPAIVTLGVVVLGAAIWSQTHRRSPDPAAPSAARPSAVAMDVKTSVVSAPGKRRGSHPDSVRADMFSRPLPPSPPPPAPPAPPAKQNDPPPARVIVPPPPDPLADYAYTGTVTVDGQPMALIENRKTREGSYVKEGDPFLGGTITHLDTQSLTLHLAGTDHALAKNQNYSMIPLDRNASSTDGPAGPGGAPPVDGSVALAITDQKIMADQMRVQLEAQVADVAALKQAEATFKMQDAAVEVESLAPSVK